MIFNYIEINDVFHLILGRFYSWEISLATLTSLSLSRQVSAHTTFVSVESVYCQMSIFPPALPLRTSPLPLS